jgi:pimeloyl-ACP methyl ester carboxylesterase
VRTLCLTNTDVYTNSPPTVFERTIEVFRARGAAAVVNRLLADPGFARSEASFGMTYEHPETLTDELLEASLRPLVSSPERIDAFQRFILSLPEPHLVEIAPALRRLEAPTLIAWGADDPVFSVRWAYWLAGAIPGARPVVEVEGARTFWQEERPELLTDLLLDHWAAAPSPSRV